MKPFDSEKLKELFDLLREIADDGAKFASLSEQDRIELLQLTGKISRPSKTEILARNKSVRKYKEKLKEEHDRNLRKGTGIREARETTVFQAPSLKELPPSEEWIGELTSPRPCYICKTEYSKIHFFYDAMCPECSRLNYQKRFQTVDLSGKTALITGSRLKIGYQATLMLLRAGAKVIATTRFPMDSALRFAKETDFSAWKDRLQIFGLDLRHTPSVEIFCNYILTKEPRLDFILNNAAQTVRRPPGFYAHLMAEEMIPIEERSNSIKSLLSSYEDCLKLLPSYSSLDLSQEKALPVAWTGRVVGIGLHSSAKLSQIPYTHDHSLSVEEVFPEGKLDADLQQVDLRKTNSWRLKLGEIPTAEMIEVQLVNAIAPFVLNNKLIPLMKADFTGEKHIVNVSAMEGKFHRFKKEDRHPHTNMAKAALNMMTHTSASDLGEYGIFTNAVDTGWVTDEDPAHLAKWKTEVQDFQPPLDIVDGAARILDPIFNGILTGKHWNGKFLKDYFPIDW